MNGCAASWSVAFNLCGPTGSWGLGLSRGVLAVGVPRVSKGAFGHFVGDVDDWDPSAEREVVFTAIKAFSEEQVL